MFVKDLPAGEVFFVPKDESPPFVKERCAENDSRGLSLKDGWGEVDQMSTSSTVRVEGFDVMTTTASASG